MLYSAGLPSFLFLPFNSHLVLMSCAHTGLNMQRSLSLSADIWSLGVILFMLVCGQPPFQEANDSETLTMIMDCKYTVPPHISDACRKWVAHTRTHISTQMDRVLCRCCIFHVYRCVKKRESGLSSAAPHVLLSLSAAVSCTATDAALR